MVTRGLSDPQMVTMSDPIRWLPKACQTLGMSIRWLPKHIPTKGLSDPGHVHQMVTKGLSDPQMMVTKDLSDQRPVRPWACLSDGYQRPIRPWACLSDGYQRPIRPWACLSDGYQRPIRPWACCMKLKTGEVWAVLVKRTYFPTAQSCVSGHSHCQHSNQMLDVKPLWD